LDRGPGERTSAASAARDGRTGSAAAPGRHVVTKTLRVPQSARPRPSALDWEIYDIAVELDERRIFFSYHGPNTTGADWLEVGRGTLARCRSTARAACLAAVHGAIEADRDGLVAALGTPPLLGRFSRDGERIQVWPSGFRDAHLMEFARLGDRVFTVESCTKKGGMTVIDLARREAEVLHPPAPATPLRGLPARAVCGERISIGSGGLIAVMKRGTITGIGGIMLLDDRGRVGNWLRLAPPPVDVLVLP
jgi:hypothetical protein